MDEGGDDVGLSDLKSLNITLSIARIQ